MSQNYDLIIDKVDKYYYFISSTKKIILLGSSNNLKKAKELTIKKLEPNIDSFIGKKLVFIRVLNTYDKFKNDKSNKNSLSLIGGPIALEILIGTIDNKKKINNEKETGNNKFYLSKKYIKKNIDNIATDLKKVIKKYHKNLLSQSILNVNIL
jgi:hypothetical protein